MDPEQATSIHNEGMLGSGEEGFSGQAEAALQQGETTQPAAVVLPPCQLDEIIQRVVAQIKATGLANRKPANRIPAHTQEGLSKRPKTQGRCSQRLLTQSRPLAVLPHQRAPG